MNAVQTTHGLDFEQAKWEPLPGFPIAATFARFRIGTCEGLYSFGSDSLDILAITNSDPGNGHFEDVLQWFEFACKRDKKDFRFLEIMNKDFKKHLLTKRKFKPQGKDNVIKKFKNL
jgi:hypothetical protein